MTRLIRVTRRLVELVTLRLRPLRGRDDGMTTVEYAVGTIAAAGFAGLLFKVATSDPVREALSGVITSALNVAT